MRHNLDDKWLLLILVSAMMLDIWAIWWGLPNTAEWDADSSVPMTTLRGALNQFSFGWFGQHQPLQPALIALLCVPLFAYVYLTGGINLSDVQRTYPWGLRDPEWVLSGVILIGRLLSLASHLLLIWAMYQIGLRLRGRVTALAAAVLGALYYPFVYYAHVGNPDMLYIALLAVAVLACFAFLEKPSARSISWLAFWAALSTSVKFQALPFFAGMVPVVLWVLLADQRRTDRQGPARTRKGLGLAGLGLVIFVATFAVANNWMLNFDSSMEWIANKKRGAEGSKETRAEWARLAASMHAADPMLRLSFAEGTWVCVREGFSLPVLGLGALGLVLLVSTQPIKAAALVGPSIAYGAFYWYVNAAFDRYLFPLVVPLLLMAAFGAERLWQASLRFRAYRFALGLVAIVLAIFLLARVIALDYVLLNGSRQQAERWFAERPQYRDATVIVYQDPDGAPRLQDLVRLRSLGPASYFADKKNQTDPKRHFRRPAVPDEVKSLPYLLNLDPEFVVLFPADRPDNEVDYLLRTNPGKYRVVASFGGPTRLVRRTFAANPKLEIWQRVRGTDPDGAGSEMKHPE
ncbi:MAG: glycosyltransferase family 39 protein [Armatimonadetes bacterium]|nr:glycosyltransferase family 39 protein [Armatimonadota bacterium]